jgi:hypothetical protein
MDLRALIVNTEGGVRSELTRMESARQEEGKRIRRQHTLLMVLGVVAVAAAATALLVTLRASH